MEENINIENKQEENKQEEDNSVVKKTKKNNWKIASFVLGVLFIVSIISSTGLLSISGNAAAIDAVEFINNELLQGQTIATLEDVTKENGLTKAVINIEGQATPIYISKDGKLMFLQAIPLDGETTTPVQQSPPAQQPINVPKSDKPVVDLFIMSHCPYGTQMEKGILPVVKVLEDDIDFNLKFVYYAMHPTQGEVEEQLNQYCIREEQEDKLLDYLYCFLEDGDGERCLAETNIDTSMLETCVAYADAEFEITKNLEDQSLWLSGRFPLFNTDKADNEKYSVAGSPTLVINGKTASSGRDSESLLKTVCAAFNNEPEACTTTEFEAGSPSPGFGWDATAQANSATAGCGY